jgi:hypothetical protein
MQKHDGTRAWYRLTEGRHGVTATVAHFGFECVLDRSLAWLRGMEIDDPTAWQHQANRLMHGRLRDDLLGRGLIDE